MKVHYEVIDQHHRDDPWIVMVHGFSHHSGYFSSQVREFQEDYRILLTDLRGHGRSSNMEGPFGVEEYADDVLEVIKEVGIQKAHFWGTHTGSAIGLVLALRDPVRFSSLILEGTFLPGFPMPRVGELLGRAKKIAKSSSVASAVEDWLAHADWFDYMNTHPLECRVEELRTITRTFGGAPWLSELTARAVTPAADRLGEITQPVFVYNGRNDIPDFLAAAEELKNKLLIVQSAVIEHGGGFPGWEDPIEVNNLVRQFLPLVRD